MPRIQPGPPCIVCGSPSKARNLCPTHHSRWLAHGHTEQTRPDDWGKRNKHPLNQTWRWTLRGNMGRVPRWNDFNAFLEDVGERPTPGARLKRYRQEDPFGPDNCYWQEPLVRDPDAKSKRAHEQREWRKRNPEKAKSYDLKKHYGISLIEYNDMLDAQGGKCAICGETDRTFGRLVVDHCHDSRKIRGLLCSLCNRSIGGLRHSVEILEKAIDYLRR